MRARPVILCSAVIGASLLVSACALVGGPADRAMRRSPEFRAGYSDGCAAANAAGADFRRGPHKQDDAYRTSRTYRQGWANGLQTCRRGNASPGSNPVRDPTPGYQGH